MIYAREATPPEINQPQGNNPHRPGPMAHGQWPMAHGPWPMAQGPWPKAHGPWHMAHGPRPMAYGLWPKNILDFQYFGMNEHPIAAMKL